MTLEPGSAEWMQYITASKVAVILGISPYSSPKILWHQMKGTLPREETTTSMSRGHYLEPAILEWFYDQHPELESLGTQTCYNKRIPWAAANPDSLAGDRHSEFFPVEAKSDSDGDGWGRPGSDVIPIYYAAQGLWTMHVTQTRQIFFPMIGPWLEFAEYRMDYHPAKAAQMEAECFAFYQSLSGDVAPPLSDHPKEYEVLRKLHPAIDLEAVVDLDTDLARRFLKAKQAEKSASAEWSAARAAVGDVMGEAAAAYCGGTLVAIRTSKGQGTPYVATPRKLPALEAIAS